MLQSNALALGECGPGESEDEKSPQHLLCSSSAAACACIPGHALRCTETAGPPSPESGIVTGRTERCEGIRDLELTYAEPVYLGRPAAGASRLAPRARRLEHVAPQQHALQVRRRDVVAEGGGIEVAQLGERERGGASAKPTLV